MTVLLVKLNWYEAKENRAGVTSRTGVTLDGPTGLHTPSLQVLNAHIGVALRFPWLVLRLPELWTRLYEDACRHARSLAGRRTRGTALRWQRKPQSQNCANKKMINHLKNGREQCVLQRQAGSPVVNLTLKGFFCFFFRVCVCRGVYDLVYELLSGWNCYEYLLAFDHRTKWKTQINYTNSNTLCECRKRLQTQII